MAFEKSSIDDIASGLEDLFDVSNQDPMISGFVDTEEVLSEINGIVDDSEPETDYQPPFHSLSILRSPSPILEIMASPDLLFNKVSLADQEIGQDFHLQEVTEKLSCSPEIFGTDVVIFESKKLTEDESISEDKEVAVFSLSKSSKRARISNEALEIHVDSETQELPPKIVFVLGEHPTADVWVKKSRVQVSDKACQTSLPFIKSVISTLPAPQTKFADDFHSMMQKALDKCVLSEVFESLEKSWLKERSIAVSLSSPESISDNSVELAQVQPEPNAKEPADKVKVSGLRTPEKTEEPAQIQSDKTLKPAIVVPAWLSQEFDYNMLNPFARPSSGSEACRPINDKPAVQAKIQHLLEFHARPQPYGSNKVLEAKKQDPGFISNANALKTRLLAMSQSNSTEAHDSEQVCWNCRESGHERANCPLRALGIVNFVCFGCGEKGKTTKTCPKCGPKRKAKRRARKLHKD